MSEATGKRLLWIAAQGFGSGANPNGPNPYVASDNNLLHHPGTAVLSSGRAGILTFPSGRRLNVFTLVGNRQVIPINLRTAPAGTPLRPGGPIKHVLFIVRANRTYDQVLGDDPRFLDQCRRGLGPRAEGLGAELRRSQPPL